MAEERVIHGQWRLPQWRPQRGVIGTLTLGDGFRLDLDGTLLTTDALRRQVRYAQRPARLPRILGFADEVPKLPVTLDDCAYAGGSHSSNIWVGETFKDAYWPRVVALGAWFEHNEPLVADIAFDSYTAAPARSGVRTFAQARVVPLRGRPVAEPDHSMHGEGEQRSSSDDFTS